MGQSLTFTVGVPNDHLVWSDVATRQEQTLYITDDVGLTLDPKMWARKRCSTCEGNGVYVTRRPLTEAEAVTMYRKDPNAATAIERTKHAYALRLSVSCACAKARYEQARAMFAKPPSIEFKVATPLSGLPAKL